MTFDEALEHVRATNEPVYLKLSKFCQEGRRFEFWVIQEDDTSVEPGELFWTLNAAVRPVHGGDDLYTEEEMYEPGFSKMPERARVSKKWKPAPTIALSEIGRTVEALLEAGL